MKSSTDMEANDTEKRKIKRQEIARRNAEMADAFDENLRVRLNSLPPTAQSVFHAIHAYPDSKTQRIAQIVGKSVPTVSIAVADLKRFGLVEHFGSPKTGGYRISEKVEKSIKGMDRNQRVRIIMELEDFRQLQIDFG